MSSKDCDVASIEIYRDVYNMMIVIFIIACMNNPRDYAGLVNAELINSIQIHYSTSKDMTFVNTVLH